MMSKIRKIAAHEYRRIVFRKSFLLTLISVPLMITVCVGMGLFMESVKNNDAPVGYVDHAGVLSNPIPPPVDGPKQPVKFVPFPAEDDAKKGLKSGNIQAYYVIANDYCESRKAKRYFVKEPGRNASRQFWDFIQINLMKDHPSEIAHRAALTDNVTVRSLDGRRELPKYGPTFGIIMPLLISLAFLMLLVFSSGYLMAAVADEKENRTMEVLLTSVSPTQLIGGKVLGISAVTFTQFVIWAAVAVCGIAIARHVGLEWFQDLSLDWGTVGAAVVVAIPTYVLAAALMAAIGAAVTSSQEGQSVGAVFFMLLVVPPWLSAYAIVTAPQSLLPSVLSLAPFTALLTIALRNIFMTVPGWQIAASAAVQTFCAVGAICLAGKALRIGTLRYGQRVMFRELLMSRSR
jgi:ABC-2 type transport system permease protein